MPDREPFWYCHECHAEMRPLMTPDPVCASCNGSFVEKLEDGPDDPREFQQHGPDFDGADFPPGFAPFLQALTGMMGTGPGIPRPPNAATRENTNRSSSSPQQTARPTASSFSFQVRTGPGAHTIVIANPPTNGPGGIPTMSEFLGSPPTDTRGGAGITAPLMAQYLRVLMGRDPFSELMPMGPDGGQMGDYVFNQEALDRIITQLMENSNSSRPVPATEEIMEKLPREVLEAGSATLEKDCAVCKEQFQLETEDPSEQIIVTLPCKHPFHEPCIMPWLKSSGTCPVCRFALVPQPEHHGNAAANADGNSTSTSQNRSPSPASSSGSGGDREHGGAHGLFQSLFGGWFDHHHHAETSSSQGSSTSPPGSPPGRNSNPTSSGTPRPNNSQNESRRRGSGDNGRNIPGRWDDLD